MFANIDETQFPLLAKDTLGTTWLFLSPKKAQVLIIYNNKGELLKPLPTKANLENTDYWTILGTVQP